MRKHSTPRTNLVCFTCRKASRAEIHWPHFKPDREILCQGCQKPMVNVSHRAAVPPRKCDRKWKRFEADVLRRKELDRTLPERVAAVRLQMRDHDRSRGHLFHRFGPRVLDIPGFPLT